MRTKFLRAIVLLALNIMLLPALTSGQSLTAVGFKVGLTRASQLFSGSGYVLESRTGFDVGAFAVWFDHSWLRVSSEIHFVQKKTGFPDMPVTTVQYPEGTGEFIKITYAFDYISASILPKLRASFGVVEVYGLLGPRIDLLVHRAANIDAFEPFRSLLQQSFDSHLQHYKDVEIGGDFALGCQFSGVFLSGLGLEVRYSPDFTTSHDVPSGTITNSSWEFLLTVSL